MRQLRRFLAQLSGQHFRQLRLVSRSATRAWAVTIDADPGAAVIACCSSESARVNMLWVVWSDTIAVFSESMDIASSMSMRLRCTGWAIPASATGW